MATSELSREEGFPRLDYRNILWSLDTDENTSEWPTTEDWGSDAGHDEMHAGMDWSKVMSTLDSLKPTEQSSLPMRFSVNSSSSIEQSLSFRSASRTGTTTTESITSPMTSSLAGTRIESLRDKRSPKCQGLSEHDSKTDDEWIDGVYAACTAYGELQNHAPLTLTSGDISDIYAACTADDPSRRSGSTNTGADCGQPQLQARPDDQYKSALNCQTNDSTTRVLAPHGRQVCTNSESKPQNSGTSSTTSTNINMPEASTHSSDQAEQPPSLSLSTINSLDVSAFGHISQPNSWGTHFGMLFGTMQSPSPPSTGFTQLSSCTATQTSGKRSSSCNSAQSTSKLSSGPPTSSTDMSGHASIISGRSSQDPRALQGQRLHSNLESNHAAHMPPVMQSGSSGCSGPSSEAVNTTDLIKSTGDTVELQRIMADIMDSRTKNFSFLEVVSEGRSSATSMWCQMLHSDDEAQQHSKLLSSFDEAAQRSNLLSSAGEAQQRLTSLVSSAVSPDVIPRMAKVTRPKGRDALVSSAPQLSKHVGLLCSCEVAPCGGDTRDTCKTMPASEIALAREKAVSGSPSERISALTSRLLRLSTTLDRPQAQRRAKPHDDDSLEAAATTLRTSTARTSTARTSTARTSTARTSAGTSAWSVLNPNDLAPLDFSDTMNILDSNISSIPTPRSSTRRSDRVNDRCLPGNSTSHVCRSSVQSSQASKMEVFQSWSITQTSSPRNATSHNAHGLTPLTGCSKEQPCDAGNKTGAPKSNFLARLIKTSLARAPPRTLHSASRSASRTASSTGNVLEPGNSSTAADDWLYEHAERVRGMSGTRTSAVSHASHASCASMVSHKTSRKTPVSHTSTQAISGSRTVVEVHHMRDSSVRCNTRVEVVSCAEQKTRSKRVARRERPRIVQCLCWCFAPPSA